MEITVASCVRPERATPRIPTAQALGVDQLAESITGWEQVYDQISPGRFSGHLTEVLLGPAQIFVETSSHALVQQCRTWDDAVWFGIPVQPERVCRVEGIAIEADMLAVRHGGSDFQLTTPDRFGFLGIVVKTPVLRQYLEAEGAADIEAKLFQERALRTARGCLDRLRDKLNATLQGDMLPAHGFTTQMRAELLDETVTDLVQVLAGRAAPAREGVCAQHARNILRRSRDYLIAHSEQCVSVQQLCDELGSSRRALQDCFRKHLGVTPKHYLRAFGLNAARRELRRRDSDCATVSDVATRYGFWHLSQFAVDYRRLFGELPSETLRRRHAA
ncbi:MAG: helix-turn-helix domain-containing protein [Solirubrobacteraceae bacterium]|nr:helix-turn-helix domain-containing protein [Solirubrobacteraceae bacterium]